MENKALYDLFTFAEHELPKVRIRFHFSQGKIDELKSLYLSDKNQINDLTIFYTPEGKNYFHAGTIVLNFIQIEVDKWLLTTVKEVIEELPATSKKAYNGIVRQEYSEYSEYFDRLIVGYPVNKIIVQNFERSAQNIIISEILSSALTGNSVFVSIRFI